MTMLQESLTAFVLQSSFWWVSDKNQWGNCSLRRCTVI
jgi:hypothetical protein